MTEKVKPKFNPKWKKHDDGFWYFDLEGCTLHLGKKHGTSTTRLVLVTGDWVWKPTLVPTDQGADE